MAEQVPRFSFQPLERRGVLFGLHAGQLAALVGACAAGLAIRVALGGRAGTAAAVVLGAGLVAGSVWNTRGRPPLVWAGLALSWSLRSAVGRRMPGDAPLIGSAAEVEALIGIGTGAGIETGAEIGAVAPAAPVPLPGTVSRRGPVQERRPLAPPGMELREDRGLPGDDPLGVIRDVRHGTWAAVVAVRGRPYSLLDPADQAGRLEMWRRVLGALARPGSPIRRVQWVERTGPAPVEELYESLRRIEAPAGDLAGGRLAGGASAQVSGYRELLEQSAQDMTGHDAWVVLAVDMTRRRGRGGGSGEGAGVASLRRELRLLEGQLRAADLEPGRPLDLAGLAAVVEAGRDVRPPRPRAGARAAWPLASDEGWAHLHSDGAWHATYWIAEWPRVEVGPDFLLPLLLGAGRRSVSLIMAPVPAERAIREVRSSRTADLADSELRQKAGFLPSARREMESEGALRREAELADGHCEYRFSGYVTVTAGSEEELGAACAEAEHAAQSGRMELRRLYGRQAEALTWTLPLARGLR